MLDEGRLVEDASTLLVLCASGAVVDVSRELETDTVSREVVELGTVCMDEIAVLSDEADAASDETSVL